MVFHAGQRLQLGVHACKIQKKSSIFAADLKPRKVMQDAERQELESQIADLKQRLHKAEMQNLALNTLIDVAEEQGLAIRKKCGAKQ